MYNFGLGDVSWEEKTKYSVCILNKLIEPTMIYTEPRILRYSFLDNSQDILDLHKL